MGTGEELVSYTLSSQKSTIMGVVLAPSFVDFVDIKEWNVCEINSTNDIG